MACGIGRENRELCMLKDELLTLMRVFGVGGGSGSEYSSMTAKDIMQELFKRVNCSSETCVIERIGDLARDTVYESIVHRIREMAFKVDGPLSTTALLDNFLLIRMCRQIEKNYKGIRFGGVVTYDFMIPPIIGKYGSPRAVYACWEKNKWNQLQFILNVDHRMGGGQHWVALIVAMEGGAEAKKGTESSSSIMTGCIEYFDSYGSPPMSGLVTGSYPYSGITDPKGQFLSRMDEWIEEVRGEFIKRGIGMKYRYNETCHQEGKDKFNCGVYSILFLRARAKRISFVEFNSKRISMTEITEQREKLYSPKARYEPTPPTPTPI